METRRKLLRSALQLFTEKGIDATTIAEITEESDLGKGTFYRHFETKTEVVQSLTQAAVDGLIAQIRQPAAKPADLSAAVAHLLRCHSAFFKSRWKEFMLLFQGQLLVRLQRDEVTAAEAPYAEYLKELEAQVEPHMPGGVSAGRIRKLAFGLGAFVSGFLSLSAVGIPDDEMESGLDPLRKAFVASAVRLLTEKPSAEKAPAEKPVAPASSKTGVQAEQQQKGDAADAGT
jgi:AcrR family transcriptional regulator